MNAPAGGSWITKPIWQVIVGTFIAACIVAAGAISFAAVQSERDQRQNELASESISRDVEIKKESVRITCGFLKGFDRLTPPIQLSGGEDAATVARVAQANADRLASRQILRDSVPMDIVKQCPQTP